jgi:hypothetical protein
LYWKQAPSFRLILYWKRLGISNFRKLRYTAATAYKAFPMAHLSSKEALQLAATFALTAEYMRTADQSDVQTRANFYEQASRAAFLRAEAIAKNEEVRVLGESFRRAAFAVV